MQRLVQSGRDSSPDQSWKRVYLLLVLVRLYFALSSSYLHPDEHFQGPEVVAGHVLSYPYHKTWEFKSDTPIRSVFPLWLVYGLPMLALRYLSEGFGSGAVKASTVFWVLRALVFVLNFVLEDRAVYELVDAPRQRRLALLLVSSSYVTWTWQVHTFSNSIETLVVLWTLVLMKRLTKTKNERSGVMHCAILAFLMVFGSFNRVTFPAYVIVPALQFASRVWHRLAVLVTLATTGVMTAVLAVVIDTTFYRPNEFSFPGLLHHPVITPLNNLLYNSRSANLALHGTHPYYQHLLINLPLLLGPAFPLLLSSANTSTRFWAAISGVCLISCFSHQEARFLLAAVPLLLSSVQLPKRLARQWIALWIIFNVLLGVLMGIFHQGGVVTAQMYLGRQGGISEAYWWKTYSPPTWLLGGSATSLETIDLMGLDSTLLEIRLCENLGPHVSTKVLIAPSSATFLDSFQGDVRADSRSLHLKEIWKTARHLNLDDMDLPSEGLLATVSRVIGRRGLKIWDIQCKALDSDIESEEESLIPERAPVLPSA